MHMKTVPALTGCVVAVALSVSPASAAPDTTAMVRGAHFSPDTPSVDVYLTSFSGGTTTLALSYVGYGDVSKYQRLQPGLYTVGMRPAGASPSTPVVFSWKLDAKPGTRVLEIGCGTGNLTIRAKRAFPAVQIVGSDPDPLALQRAQRKAIRLNGISFERGYAQRLPYADGEFDRVLSSMMLHHLDGNAKSLAAAQVFRVLRPGGRLHVVDIGGNMTASDGLAARLVARSPHAAGSLGDAIPRVLAEAGFDCTELATQRHRFVGRLTYYRAVRPA